MNLKAYMCVVTTGVNKDINILTSGNYLELIYKVIDNIMETQGDDYPNLSKFQVPNSIDFIGEYDEEDYRSVLNEIFCFLATEGSDYQAKIFELDQEIDDEQLVNISHDVF